MTKPMLHPRFWFPVILTGLLVTLWDGSAQTKPGDAPEIVVTDVAFGKLTGLIDFDEAVIQALYPELKVVREMSAGEGYEYPIISVSRGDDLLFVIESDIHYERVAAVVTWNPAIRIAAGHRIGQEFGSIYGDETPKGLSTHVNLLDGIIRALAPGTNRIIYTFSIPDGFEPTEDGKTPPPAKLKHWPLDSIRWLP